MKPIPYIARYMKKSMRILGWIMLGTLSAYLIWAYTGRTPPPIATQLQIDRTIVVNSNSGKGNVIGINTWMEPADYASREHFFAKLDGYLNSCKEKNWLDSKTTVLFPEYIGTWLVLEGEKKNVYTAETIDDALTHFVITNYFRYIASWFMSPDSATNKMAHSIFATKAKKMADTYTNVFSRLAKKYQVTIIAGSILLQSPRIKNNKIMVRNGSLENVSAVFNPDGSIQPALTRKSFPTADELPFTIPFRNANQPMYDLPIGKTSVMICADAWYPQAYQAIQPENPRFIAVPSYTPTDGSMQKGWDGYSGFEAPADIQKEDIGNITLRDAWLKYTMPTRIRQINVPFGMTASLRGKLWDLGSDGEPIIYNRGEVICPPPGEGASLVCLWLH
jgi:predicted amidohydrolase